MEYVRDDILRQSRPGNLTIESQLEDKDDLGNIPLHYSALNGHVETTDFLCDSGAEVGAR